MPATRRTWSVFLIAFTLGAAGHWALALDTPTPSPSPPLKPAEPAALPKPAELVRREVAIYSTRGDNKLHVVESGPLKPIASIDIGLGAHELAISPDGRWVAGSAYGGPGHGHQPADNRIAVVDMHAMKLHRLITLEGSRPNDMVFLPKADGSAEFLATIEMPPTLARINAMTGATKLLPIEKQAGHMLAHSPVGGVAVVAHVFPGSLTFVNLADWKVIGQLDKLPLGAEGIAMSPDGTRVWVASNRANAISIVSVADRKVEKKLDCSGFPFRVRFSPDGKSVAVSCAASAEIALFNAADPDKVDRVTVIDAQHAIPLAPNATEAADKLVPTSIAYSSDGGSLFVICDGSKPQLLRIDLAKRNVAQRTPSAGPIPDALVVGMAAMPKPG